MVKLEDAVEVIAEAAVPLETLYLCCMDMDGLSPELKAGIKHAVTKIRLFTHKLNNDKLEKVALSANIDKLWTEWLELNT